MKKKHNVSKKDFPKGTKRAKGLWIVPGVSGTFSTKLEVEQYIAKLHISGISENKQKVPLKFESDVIGHAEVVKVINGDEVEIALTINDTTSGSRIKEMIADGSIGVRNVRKSGKSSIATDIILNEEA